MSKVDRIMQGFVEVAYDRIGRPFRQSADEPLIKERSSHSKLTPEQRAKRRAKGKSAKRARKA